MPRFLNERTTTSATSRSHPGRIFGSASKSVTWTPRSDIIEANSQPMAPPPITTTEPGSLSSSSTSSEVSTYLPSISKPGIVRGTEPVGDQHVLAGDPLDGTVGAGHLDDLAFEQPAAAVEGHDLAPGEQTLQSLEQLLDHLALAVEADRELDRRLAGVDPELLGLRHRPVDRRRLEELLCGHAAAVQAGPPHLVHLDEAYRQPGGAGVQGGRVATRAAADDHEIELRRSLGLVGRTDHLPPGIDPASGAGRAGVVAGTCASI